MPFSTRASLVLLSDKDLGFLRIQSLSFKHGVMLLLVLWMMFRLPSKFEIGDVINESVSNENDISLLGEMASL